MENPTKYVKDAVWSGINGTGVKVWYKRKPKSVTNVNKYAIITSIDKNPIDRAKECFDWSIQVVIDIWSIGTQGFPPEDNSLEDMEELILNVMSGLSVSGYVVYDSILLQQQDLSLETSTASIDRKAITWEIQLNVR